MSRKLFDPIAVPPAQWASRLIYCYCPACDDVVGVDKVAVPACPMCGRHPLKDIFTEMLERLGNAWGVLRANALSPRPLGVQIQNLAGDYSLVLERCVETGVLDGRIKRHVQGAAELCRP